MDTESQNKTVNRPDGKCEQEANEKRVTVNEIDINCLLGSTSNDEDGGSGATVLFVGKVRNFSTSGKKVAGMDYESYVVMAEKAIRKIEEEARSRWNVNQVRVIHRIGELKVGENSVAIVVSAAHSKEAFEACRRILRAIKSEVPIWKKERLADGKQEWVKGEPIKGGRKK